MLVEESGSNKLGARGDGDVQGPATSIDNSLVRWDGADGTTIQDDSTLIEDDGGKLIQRVKVPVFEQSLTGTALAGTDACMAADGFLFVTAADDGALTIFDITNPADPIEVGVLIDLANLEGATTPVLGGNILYVIAGVTQRVVAIDVTDKSSPVIVDTLIDIDFQLGQGLFLNGNTLYACAAIADLIMSIDVSDPTNMVVLDKSVDANYFDPRELHGFGDVLYWVGGSGNLLGTLDISDPRNLTIIDSVALALPISMSVSGGFGFLVTIGDASLRVFDLSDPANITQVGIITDATNLVGPGAVEVFGDYAYVTLFFGDGLTVIDIRDKTDPKFVARLTDAAFEEPLQFCIEGGRAYIPQRPLATVLVVCLTGADFPTLRAGNLSTTDAIIHNNAAIGGQLTIGSGLSVGVGGVACQGPLSAPVVKPQSIAPGQQATAVSALSDGQLLIRVTNTAVPRVVTIRTVDIIDGLMFIVKDESGLAGTNNITVVGEGGELIDGAANVVIVVNFGVVRLYSDGVGLFIW